MAKRFSVKETVGYAVNVLIAHPWYFLKLFVLWIIFSILILMPIMLLFIGIGIFKGLGIGGLALAGIAILLLYCLALVYIWTGPTKLILNFYDTDSARVSLGDFFRLFSISQLFRLLATFILYVIAAAVGLALFIIPGIYLMVKLQFSFYYVIDRNIPVMNAFKKSYTATTGNFWRILAVDIIGAILLQLIITTPMSYLMGVYMYRKLG